MLVGDADNRCFVAELGLGCFNSVKLCCFVMCAVLVAEGEPRIGGDMASNSKSMEELVVGVAVVSGMVEAGTDGSWSCIRGFLISLSA